MRGVCVHWRELERRVIVDPQSPGTWATMACGYCPEGYDVAFDLDVASPERAIAEHIVGAHAPVPGAGFVCEHALCPGVAVAHPIVASVAFYACVVHLDDGGGPFDPRKVEANTVLARQVATIGL